MVGMRLQLQPGHWPSRPAATAAAVDAGPEVTAPHHHFFQESPRVRYMHIGGRGTAERLAPAVRKVLDAVRSMRTVALAPDARFAGDPVTEKSAITAATIGAILGVKGEPNNGIYKATIGARRVDAREQGGKADGRPYVGRVCGVQEDVLGVFVCPCDGGWGQRSGGYPRQRRKPARIPRAGKGEKR